MSPLALPVAAILLLCFTLVATLDGLYLHLYRYRLYARPASRYEHRLHTANALIFPLLTYLLFCREPRGPYLWAAAGLFLATFFIEIADVRCEYQSRADLGGLSSNEYFMHFLMSALRFGGLVPLLVLPAEASWRLDAGGLFARPLWFALLGYSIALPGVITATLHVALDLRHRA